MTTIPVAKIHFFIEIPPNPKWAEGSEHKVLAESIRAAPCWPTLLPVQTPLDCERQPVKGSAPRPGAIDRLVARGFIDVVEERGEGRILYYGMPPTGETACQELSDSQQQTGNPDVR